MTEALARELIIGSGSYFSFQFCQVVTLDGAFDADTLDALAWWLRNMPEDAVCWTPP